jgi:hypothetical protein
MYGDMNKIIKVYVSMKMSLLFEHGFTGKNIACIKKKSRELQDTVRTGQKWFQIFSDQNHPVYSRAIRLVHKLYHSKHHWHRMRKIYEMHQ